MIFCEKYVGLSRRRHPRVTGEVTNRHIGFLFCNFYLRVFDLLNEEG